MASATKPRKPRVRKVTILLPADLLDRAVKATGETITSTIAAGLERVAVRDVNRYFLSRQGKYRYSVDLAELRD